MNALKLRKWCVWITMLFMAQDFARKVFHWERRLDLPLQVVSCL